MQVRRLFPVLDGQSRHGAKTKATSPLSPATTAAMSSNARERESFSPNHAVPGAVDITTV